MKKKTNCMSAVIGTCVVHNVRKIMLLLNKAISVYKRNFLCKTSLYLVIFIANNAFVL